MSRNVDTILLIDDETADREAMADALKRAGFRVFQAGDYDSALTMFDKHSAKINSLVADVSLPGRNGCDLAKTLLERKGDLRVLFISGHAGAEVVRFYGIDASDLFFLRKPFPPDELAVRVRQVLDSTDSLPSIILRLGTGN